jgi:hypothetical protein
MGLFLENLIKSFFVGTVFFLGVFLTGLALQGQRALWGIWAGAAR